MFQKYQIYSRWISALIAYSLLVFLWGAWVRISGSGDGCGEHWPFCHGEWIPSSYAVKVWIENFHRISTKLYGLWVIALCLLAWRWFPKGHAVRKGILSVLFFTLIEGLIGAVLVIKGFVANDDSLERTILIALHLMNTFLLMASLFYTWFVSRYDVPQLKIQFSKIIMLLFAIGLLAIGGTGAVAALSTTLFPSESLLAGLQTDFSENAHFLQRLRILHPIFAIGLVIFTFMTWKQWIRSKRINSLYRLWSQRFLVSLVIVIFVGTLTLGMLSPTALKLTHLLTAHLIWICFCGLYLASSLPDAVIKKITTKTPQGT